MTDLLSVVGLSRHFGGVIAVDGVTFTVQDRQLRSIIGSNGAGKTTLFNLMTGRIPATGGKILLNHKDITNWPAHRIVTAGISRTFQRSSFFPGLTVFENVRIAVQRRCGGSSRFWASKERLPGVAEQVEETLHRVGIADSASVLARTLSHGDQRLLEVGMAIALAPKILLLDEPTAGMSPRETERTAKIVRGLASTIAVVLVEHDMDMVMSISDQITVMHRGRIIAEGTPKDIQQNVEVREAYLGTAA
ncbi:MAG: ABC transporter ATP-binding protein [Alphaproteobacteria bacterium]|nr:ABC transporter ATP-binding protein [Alphaproteobacteria bacterium]